MNDSPVTFNVQRPESFDRVHIMLRLAILVAISVLAAFAWLLALIYLVLPIVTAAFASRSGSGEAFMKDEAPRLKKWIHWVASADAYMTLLTDKIPSNGPEESSSFDVQYSGSPTTGSALLRLVTSIPIALYLVVLGIVASITAIVAAVIILFTEDYPDALYGFHTAVVRKFARMLAYHASLTDVYPGFGLDTEYQSAPAASPTVDQPV